MKKVGVILVDLSAAYDTVWHRGLTLILLRTIPRKQMVEMIMGMLCAHDGNKKSRRRTLKNGVPQDSVLAPALFTRTIYHGRL